MRVGLSIGDFSRVTHLSVKMLRRYHESGLLDPAEVDPATGYRYYSSAQIPTAQVIRHFRELGMPVREVREVLATSDPQARNDLIGAHLARLEAQLNETRAAVTSLRRLLEPSGVSVEVEHRQGAAIEAAAISSEAVAHAEVLAWYSGAMAELELVLTAAGITPNGPRGGLYDNALFTEDLGSAVVYIPVADAPTAGRVHPFVVPAAELAVTVHQGPHDDIDVTYGALGAYVSDNVLAVAGPVRETYLVGPGDTAQAADWRTEIGWPVFRLIAE